jgi:hypothetical protein
MELTPVVALSHTSLCTDATILAAHPADVVCLQISKIEDLIKSRFKKTEAQHKFNQGIDCDIINCYHVGYEQQTKKHIKSYFHESSFIQP